MQSIQTSFQIYISWFKVEIKTIRGRGPSQHTMNSNLNVITVIRQLSHLSCCLEISSDDGDGQGLTPLPRCQAIIRCLQTTQCSRGSVHINHNTPRPRESDRVIYHRVTGRVIRSRPLIGQWRSRDLNTGLSLVVLSQARGLT